MPFNMVGFSDDAPGAVGTDEVPVGLAERLYRVAVNDLYVTKEAPYVLGVFYAYEATGARCLLRQPKMVDYNIIKGCITADRDAPRGQSHYFGRPLPLRVDKLNALTVNAANEDTIIGVMLGSGKITQAMLDKVNPTHVIEGYSPTTIVANTWTHCPVVWYQDLDAGVYEIVGMRAQGYLAANLWSGLIRIAIPGSMSWQPGVPAHLGGADYELYSEETYEPWTRWPLMGVRFDTEHMPNIEALSPSAWTHERVELTLQKVA